MNHPSLALAIVLALAPMPVLAQQTKLNGPLARPLGGDLFQQEISPDGTRVVYLADQDTDGVQELFVTKPEPGSPPLRLAGPSIPGGDVSRFWIGPRSRIVVFTGTLDTANVLELYSVPIDGGAVRKLCADLTPYRNVLYTADAVQIDPAGTRVVYLADQDTDRVVELYSVAIDGSARVKLNLALDFGPGVTSFRIAPDGRFVAYLVNQGGVPELYSVPITGGTPVKLGPDGHRVRTEFVIDPTSSRVVFAAETDAPQRVQLWSRRLDGAGPLVPLVPDVYSSVSNLRCTRDGSRLACRLVDQTPRQELVASVALDGSGAVFLETAPAPGYAGFALELSPDGTTAVYTVGAPGSASVLRRAPMDGSLPGADLAPDAFGRILITPDGQSVLYHAVYQAPGLYSARLDLAQPPQLLESGIVNDYGLTPDGQRVVFVSAAGFTPATPRQLYSIPVAGGEAPTLLNGPLVYGGAVSTTVGQSFQVGALGHVTYVADQDVDEVFELFSVPVLGGNAARLSAPMPIGAVEGDVLEHVVTEDGRHALYLADELENDRLELFSARTDGSGMPLRLHGPLEDGEYIPAFAASPDGLTAVYWLANRTNLKLELHSVPVAGGPSVPLFGGDQAGYGDLVVDPGSTRVVFNTHSGGIEALWSVPLDGGSPAVMLDDEPSYLPVVTPDGSRVLYQVYDPTTFRGLRSVPIDGSAPAVRLDGGARVYFSELAPDGAHAVFLADAVAPNQGDAYLVPLDGSSAPVHLNPPLSAGADVVRIHAVGSHAFYLADQETVGKRELWRVPLDGSAAAVKLSGPLVAHGNVAQFEVSADGALVVYQADQEVDERWELWAAPTDGSGPVRKLNMPLAGGDVRGDGFFEDFFSNVFRLSPDGRTVAFRADPERRGQVELFAAPTDGSTPAVRIGRANAFGDMALGRYEFTPDGREIVFLALNRWTVGDPFVSVSRTPVDGSRPPRRLSGPGTANALPRHAGTSPLQLTPDGQRVVFRLDAESSGVVELFSSSLARPHRPQPGPTRLVTRGL